MKVIIAGSRTATNYKHLLTAINAFELTGKKITEVVSGTARGADKLGERWARETNVPIKRFPANWNKFGKSAGYRRNEEMAEYADYLIALWDGQSRGTKHMVDLARRERIGLLVFGITDESEEFYGA